MLNKILKCTILITLMAAGGLEVMACPKNDGFPGAVPLLERNFPGSQPFIPEWTLTLEGLQSQGSNDGDTCAAAVGLPSRFVLVSVNVVDPATGESIPEFDGFQRSDTVAQHLNEGLLRFPAIRYQAFATTVGKIKPDTPIDIKFVFSFNGSTIPSDLAVANMLVQRGLVVTGGADELLVPNHHVSVESIDGITIKDRESN